VNVWLWIAFVALVAAGVLQTLILVLRAIIRSGRAKGGRS